MNLPATRLLGRFRNVDGADLEDGSVLMIKHPLRDAYHIENMTHADVACADKLLQWCAKRGNLSICSNCLEGCRRPRPLYRPWMLVWRMSGPGSRPEAHHSVKNCVMKMKQSME
jgi:hypothetical protein